MNTFICLEYLIAQNFSTLTRNGTFTSKIINLRDNHCITEVAGHIVIALRKKSKIIYFQGEKLKIEILEPGNKIWKENMTFTITDDISSYYHLGKVKIEIEKNIQIKNFDFLQNIEPTEKVENFETDNFFKLSFQFIICGINIILMGSLTYVYMYKKHKNRITHAEGLNQTEIF